MRLLPVIALACLVSTSVYAQAPAPPPAVEMPADPGLYAIFDTSAGTIITQLFEDKTPNTVKNFVAIATGTKATLNTAGAVIRKHYYDGLTFHRVIKGFMIQTGDIRGTGTSTCGIPNIKDEIVADIKFDQVGRLAMANTGSPNTGACQIFITVGKPAGLDGQYTIFGQVVAGQDVAVKISQVPTANEKPVLPVKIKTVTIKRQQ